MSKLCLRLLAVTLLVNSAGMVLAQKYPLEKPPSRAKGGNVASLQEPDFTRFRVVTEHGVLAVFDAEEDYDGRDEPYSQLAYWNDFATEQLYFFNQLLLTEADVLQAVATIQRDLGIDMAPILIEKPEFAPLPEIIASGVWLPATESLVVSVMEGGSTADGELGQVSGLALPCVPAGGCGPAMAAASGPLSAPVRGTSLGGLFAMAQAGSGCSCGGGTPPPPDPLRFIHPIVDKLAVMEDDLLANHFDPSTCPFNEITDDVLTTVTNGIDVASAPIVLHRDGAQLRSGSASTSFAENGDSVNLQIVTTFDDGMAGSDPQWTLNQTIELNGDELAFSGSIGVVEPGGNSYSLPGGWTYSATAGPVLDPASDPEFQSALANMSAIDDSAVAGGPGASLAPYVSFPANVATMWLNYQRDRRLTYRTPTSCDGPAYQDDGGHSCTGVNIVCSDILDNVAMRIKDLTMVGEAFKKCMMGRLGCRRSSGHRLTYHSKLNVRCDDYGSCGPCFYDLESVGCNVGGRDLWYCNETTNACLCAQTVFHEASHACGALDQLDNTEARSSYRIGNWFRDECFELYPPPQP